ncbi:MAG: TolC family protein [Polyangia bacterium]
MRALLSMMFLCTSAPMLAQSHELRLDRERVVALAREQAPLVAMADARIGEARAHRVGARSPVAVNPEVGILVGPRVLASSIIVDAVATITVPVDISGATSIRAREADQRTSSAEAEAQDVRRLAIGAALDAWIVAVGTEERARLEQERGQLDDDLYASTRIRRQAGTIGDLELQLAAVLKADGAARRSRVEGEREVALLLLLGHLGLSPQSQVRLAGTLEAPSAPPLEDLLAKLSQRPDLARTRIEMAVAQTDVGLQQHLGIPSPRFTATGGRDNELFFRGGLDLPIPVYNRNQTARAVAAARRTTIALEYAQVAVRAEIELRAAYASYLAAQRSCELLRAAAPAMADAEHLAIRAYELGQSTLPNLIVARRETAATRQAYLEARVSVARARIALDAAAGALP